MVPWKQLALGWAVCALVTAAGAGAEPQEHEGESGAAPAGAAPAAPDEGAAPADPEAAGSGDPGAASSASAGEELGEVEELGAAGDLGEAEELGAAEEPDSAGREATPLAEGAPLEPAGEPGAVPGPLGLVGYDSEGREGRIHIVVQGDTLWDISEAYLGTPWVWPSIWNDNGVIANPHRIHPGDRIWITPGEMRRISAEEAETLIANVPEEPSEPAALEELPPTDEEEGPFESALSEPSDSRGTYRVAARETAGLITPERMKSAASIVAGSSLRIYLGQEDEVYIGLGESEVEPGDEFTVFRTRDKVFDPDTGRLLGYHVDILGWVRVEETHPETSRASIRMSTSEIEEGDRLTPREPLPPEIQVQAAPAGVDGKISFFPGRRVLMGFQDFVYLNRGEIDGLEVGTPLEVYRRGFSALERARAERVEVPDRVVAKLLVVRAESDAAVAVVTSSDTELTLGDRFRGAVQ